MDLRIQKTKKNLTKAFVTLREKKPVEKITVKELTQLANISKQTFYLHYRDIYDLSDQIENELIAEMMKNLVYPDDILAHIGQTTVELFNGAIAQGQFFKTIFSDSRVSVFIDKLDKEIKSAIYKQTPERRADLKVNVLITVLIQGCYHAYQQYSTVNQDYVVELLGELTDCITNQFLK